MKARGLAVAAIALVSLVLALSGAGSRGWFRGERELAVAAVAPVPGPASAPGMDAPALIVGGPGPTAAVPPGAGEATSPPAAPPAAPPPAPASAAPGIGGLADAPPETAKALPAGDLPAQATSAVAKPALPAGRPGQPPLVKARGLYITGYAAASPSFRSELIDLVDRTELNAVVIDLKNDSGDLTYEPSVPLGVPFHVSPSPIADLPGLIRDLRSRGIYTIARIVAFKDNFLPRHRPETAVHHVQGGIWADRNGIAWLNPYHKESWDYNIAIARAAARLGFAEVQFDYVRFPSDGNMSAIVYPTRDPRTRQQVIADFLRQARAELTREGVWTSADIFGVITTVGNDQGIGQYLEDLAGAVDILSPMIYPSHYAPGEFGFDNPNGKPYETVLNALEAARRRLGSAFPEVRVRPWLQDFTWGDPPYGPVEVRAEIQATYDAGYDEWLLWNAANRYTERALLPEWPGAPDERAAPAPPPPAPATPANTTPPPAAPAAPAAPAEELPATTDTVPARTTRPPVSLFPELDKAWATPSAPTSP